MRQLLLLLVLSTALAAAHHYHVRVRSGDTSPLTQVGDDDVRELSASSSGRIFLFEASSEDALRERLLVVGMKARRSDSDLVIAKVRNVNKTAVGSWGQDRIDQRALPLNNVYSPTGTGATVTAWVVDTGVEAGHADFGGRASNDFATYSPPYDCDGHGTHVSSTIGGNTYGVAPGVRIRAIKVLGCSGSGTTYTVAQGLDYILSHLTGKDVINLSLGYGGRDSVVESLLIDLMNAGVFVAASAGNSGGGACAHFPSAQDGVISVASSTISDSRSSFSNRGSCVDIFGPGSNIRAAKLGGGSRELSGTSMSSPHVTGAAAIYIQANPSASNSQIWDGLRSASTKNTITNVDGSPNRLVFVGSTSTPQPPPTSSTSSSTSSSSTSGFGSTASCTLVPIFCLLIGAAALL